MAKKFTKKIIKDQNCYLISYVFAGLSEKSFIKSEQRYCFCAYSHTIICTFEYSDRISVLPLL